MLGKNITAMNDPLVKIDINDLFDMISKSPEDLKSKINQLRNIATLDPKKYRQMKTILPYITSGMFNPGIRKTENFTSISSFIIDIDHLREKEIGIETLKFNFMMDNRVLMAYTSPSNNGLKVIFRLQEKCYDHAKFTIFYKLFCKNFSQQYGLNQVLDSKTCDVTRACFLSYDPDCYFNPSADSIDISNFVDFSSTIEVHEIQEKLKQYEKEQSSFQPETTVIQNEISPEILYQIRQKLNPNIKTKKEKLIYVPEELDKTIDKLTNKLTHFNIEVRAVENINYGKKLIVWLDTFWAEVNVFYGKKGFSIVKTPKNGSNMELADITFHLLCEELLGCQ